VRWFLEQGKDAAALETHFEGEQESSADDLDAE
jgi:hypothetical protein